MKPHWRFRCYASADGTDEIRAVYDAGSAQLRARFLSRLRILASLPEDEWHEDYAKALKGECDGLWELRFKADKTQQRPLGFKSGPGEFTILFWATEKNNRFVPLKACERALNRKAEVLKDGSRANALWLALE